MAPTPPPPPAPFLRRAQGANAPAGFASSDFEGMQAEALAWGEAGGGGGAGGLSILLPARGDGLGLFELDCAVRRARQWSLPAPAGRAGRA